MTEHGRLNNDYDGNFDDPIAAMMAREPVPAHIISDNRDTWLRRASKAAVALIILFFVANGYVQTADTHTTATSTHKIAHALRIEVRRGQQSQHQSNVELRRLRRAVRAQRMALKEQNRLLRRAGLPTISPRSLPNPGLGSPRSPAGGATQPATPRRSPAPSPSPSKGSHRSPSPHPTRSHHPSPKPTPNPVQSASCRLQKLLLGGKCHK